MVTGVAVGNATITVTTQNGSKTATTIINISKSGSTYLGYNLKGSSVYGSGAGAMNASLFIAGSNFIATTMYISMPAVNGKIKGAIYSDIGGKPGIKLGETSTITNPKVGGFQKLIGLNVSIISGTKYWLVVWGSAAFKIDCETSGGNFKWKSSNNRNWWDSFQKYGYLPSSFPTPDGSSTIKCSIYVEGGLKSAIFKENAIENAGIENIPDMVKIDVYPNPSLGIVTVRFSLLPETGSRIEILDISGRNVTSRIISGSSEEFNLENQPAGLYLVKSILDSHEIIQKLILNK